MLLIQILTLATLEFFDTIMMLVQMVQYSRLKTKVHALYHVTVDVPRTMSWKSFFDEDEAVITSDEEANVIKWHQQIHGCSWGR